MTSATDNSLSAASVNATAEEARAVAEAARETEWNRPSFAKGLYLGSFDLSLIHPWPEAKAEDVERGEDFMAKLEALCRTMSGRVIERDAKIPDEYLKGLAELGVFGMKIPREYGGLGLSLVYYGRALALVGSVHPSLGALISAHQSIGVPEPVKVFGTDEQKREYLPRCAAGAITAFLLTEPDVGSDPARMGATAVLSDDGESYVVDGVKLWTTNGVIAELVVVMARVPEHTDPDGTTHKGGISAFVVEMDSPGITVENRNTFMGLRGIENGVTRWKQRAIAGATKTPTPQLSAMATGVILNPWWEVPKSIESEVRGKAGYVSVKGKDGKVQRWRQPPGPTNALGQMKMVMPNQWAIYLHDTNARSRFNSQVRALSHGCIRTQNIHDLAAELGSDDGGEWTREKIDEVLASKKTVEANFVKPVPVYVVYFSSAALNDGTIVDYKDLYKRDAKVLQALLDSKPASPIKKKSQTAARQ